MVYDSWVILPFSFIWDQRISIGQDFMDCLDELPSFIAEKAKAELSSQLEAR